MKPFKIVFIFSLVIAIFLISGFWLKRNLVAYKKAQTKQEVTTPSQKIVNFPQITAKNELVFTSEQLNQLVSEQLKGELENPKVTIRSNEVLIEGKINKFFSQKALVSITPRVTNGNFELDVNQAKIGFLNAPKSLVEKVLSPVKNELTRKQENPQIENLRLEENKITIKFKE